MVFARVAQWYQGVVYKRLAAVGLRYEDIIMVNEDVAKALKYIPKEE